MQIKKGLEVVLKAVEKDRKIRLNMDDDETINNQDRDTQDNDIEI